MTISRLRARSSVTLLQDFFRLGASHLLTAACLACVTNARPQEAPKPAKKPPVVPTFETEKLVALVDELGARAVGAQGVPGLSIAVARDGEFLVAKGFGHADRAREVPATAETQYPIGTLTRQFTAVAVLQLSDAGKLALDDPLEKHLPAFPIGKGVLTLRHLLANTSGIPGYGAVARRHPEIAKATLDEAAFLACFADVAPAFEPGADFALDSANYALLSLIVARASGESYLTYVKRHLIDAVGLLRTDFPCDGPRAALFAKGCTQASDDAEFELPLAPRPGHATQSLCSNVRDLVTWQRALVERAVFSERASRQIMTPTALPDGNSTNYGFAIGMSRLGEYKRYAHSGGTGGSRVRVAYYSLPHVTIVVLANCASAPVDAIEGEIARLVLALPAPQVVDVELSEADMARCAGMYRIATTQVSVVVRAGALYYEGPGVDAVRLRHQGALEFALDGDPDARIVFRGAAGHVESLELRAGGFGTTAVRVH